MKNYRTMSAILLSMFCIPLFSLPVFANSSWRWISETRPHDVLPFVVFGTLLIEILSITLIAKPQNTTKLIFYVILGNLLSFAAPYLILLLFPGPIYSFAQTLEHTPFYIVGIEYLLLTLAVEVPTVYFSVRKAVGSQQKLLLTILCSNVVTTLLTALTEHLFCSGQW